MLKKRIPKLHITYKSLLVITSIIMATLCLVFIALESYNSTMNYIRNKIDTINIKIIEQQAKAKENNIIQIKKTAEYIAVDDVLLGYLEEYNSLDSVGKAMLLNKIISRISIMKQYNEYIANIAIVIGENVLVVSEADRGEYYGLTVDVIDRSEYGKHLKYGNEKALFFTPQENLSIQKAANINIESWANSYCYGGVIKSDGTIYGYLFIMIDSLLFTDLDEDTFLLDRENNVIAVGENIQKKTVQTISEKKLSQTNGETFYKEIENNQVYYKSIDPLNMNLVYVQNQKIILDNFDQYRFYLLIILLVTILLAFFLSRIISSRITQPLRKLIVSVRYYVFNKRKSYQDTQEEALRQGLSIRESVAGYLIGVVIIPVAIYLVATYFISTQIIESYVTASYSVAFEQTVDNIEYYLETKDKVMRNIIFNITVQEALDSEEELKYNYYDIVDKALILGSGRDEIFIYTDTGELIFTNTDRNLNTSIDAELMAEFSTKRIITNWIDTTKDRYGRYVFNLVQKINSLEEYNNIGFLVSQTYEYELENIYKNIAQDDTDIYIVNKDGRIISHADKNMMLTLVGKEVAEGILNSQLTNDQNQFIFRGKIGTTDWYLVAQYSKAVFDKDNKDLLYDKLYIFTFMLLITLILAFVFAFGLTRAFNRINVILQRMKIHGLSVSFDGKGPITEVNELREAFNEMIERNEDLISKLLESTKKQTELENRKRSSEITALQYQINPHFMYNSFESIHWLINKDRKKDALSMINSLSQFLRHVARADNPIVPISEEISHAKHYLDIMKMRYGEQIEYFWDIDEEVMTSETIRLSLQPVIENAIYHGIHPKQDEGVVEISCRIEDLGRTIVFSVTDNGVGITAEKIEKIMEDIRREESVESIGLHNIQSRILLYFGEEYGIRILSRESVGTTVEMKIPNTKYHID